MLSLKCLRPLIRRRLATDDFFLAVSYTRSFWVLMGGWTVNIFSSENQTLSTLSRHRRRSNVLLHLTLLTIRVRQQLSLLASENVQSQIPLHDTSHRAARYAGNFLDIARTFASTRIVLLTAYQLRNTRDIPLRSDRPWASTAVFSFN